jgi:hypothetical protein
MQTIERRAQRRLSLHWPVLLSAKRIGSIEARTENLSAGGFYCILPTPPEQGQRVVCDVRVPSYGRGNQNEAGTIVGHAEVVRVETLSAEAGYGVAFKILDFNFLLGKN